MSKKYDVPLKEATQITGLTPDTVREKADKGVLPCVRDSNGQRRFWRPGLVKYRRKMDARR